MVTANATWAQKLGYWSAIACTVFSVGYIVLQLFEWFGVLGSAGGPESASTPLGIVLLLTPSLLLGSSFLVLMASLHQRTAEPRKVWSQLGVAFATVYVVLTGMVYFIQLTLVGPRLARGETEGLEFLVFTPFDSFLYAVDILGYSFMSMATLQMYWHPLIWIASLWAVTFPGATVSLAVLFARDARTDMVPAAGRPSGPSLTVAAVPGLQG